MTELTNAEKLFNIFKGNDRSFGQFISKTGNMFTKKEQVSIQDFEKHLSGEMGVGIVPVLGSGSCHWGAIDIDNHGSVQINTDAIVKLVYEKGLPLIPCRSKSGGLHLYLFGSEALPATLIRMILTKWATDLGYGTSEVFPKQASLRDNELGNWINLPYFDEKETIRYGIQYNNTGIKKLTLSEFFDEVGKVSVTKKVLESFMVVGHEEAPPCIQSILKAGISGGKRNEAIYAMTIYYKKSSLGDYREEIYNLNTILFDKPLPLDEIKKTVNSASRRDYKYKCAEEPCKSYCDLDICLQRKWGISREDSNIIAGGMPEFTNLSVVDTSPPMWELKVDGTTVLLSTKQIRNFGFVAEAVMEKLFRVIPMMKNQDWLNILAGLMAVVEVIETPEDASIAGVLKVRLQEFLDKADFTVDGTDISERQLILRGLPVVQSIEGERIVAFKGPHFINYLKRTKSEELKGTDMWSALRSMGVGHKRMRIGTRGVNNVWYVKIDKYNRTALDPEYNGPKPEEEVYKAKIEPKIDF